MRFLQSEKTESGEIKETYIIEEDIGKFLKEIEDANINIMLLILLKAATFGMSWEKLYSMLLI